MAKAREGVGTIVAFNTTPAGYFLDFRRASGLEVSRILDPAVARSLAELYGVRDRRGQDIKSMAPLKGAAFRYRESTQGMLTHVEILPC